MPYDVWVIEPLALAREGIRLLLREPFKVSCQVPDVSALEEVAPREPPVIILFSLHSRNDGDGELEGIERLSLSYPNRVVVLADGLSLPQLKSVMGAGASGYLLHDVSVEALHWALNLVMAGEKVLPSALVDILLGDLRVAGRATAKDDAPRFSAAEIRILKQLAQGNSNKQIALNCDITEGTVKVHLKSIFKRIGATNRTQAALWALENIDRDPVHRSAEANHEAGATMA